jgi:hypothetical protein
MIRSGRLLSIAAWTLVAACSGGRSGAPGVRSAGRGGTLTVAGNDDHGDAIELSVECERFDEVVAEGG